MRSFIDLNTTMGQVPAAIVMVNRTGFDAQSGLWEGWL